MARRTRRRRARAPAWPIRLALLGIALAVVGTALWYVVAPRRPGSGSSPIGGDFGDTVRALAIAHGAPAAAIKADDPIRKVDAAFVRTWTVTLPTSMAVDQLAVALEGAGSERSATVSRSPTGDGGSDLRIDLGREIFELRLVVAVPRQTARARTATVIPATPTPRPPPPAGATGRLAVLLDDAGQSLDLVSAAAALPAPVGVAVLPFLPVSVETAIAVHKAGHEVWLHLPMEPEDGPHASPGPGAVLVGMPEADLRTTVHAALNNLPYVVGVNNHMGSKATADLRTMTWVMQELKARGVAFLDSRTSVHTVAEEAARSQGVPTGRRHVFLDNERAASAIRIQLDEAVYRALTDGEAVAIGHLAPVTIQVLTAELPRLAARGVTLVPPSELMR